MLECKMQHTVPQAVQRQQRSFTSAWKMRYCAYVQIRAASSRVYVQSPARRAANGVLAACELPKVSYKLRQQLAAALSNVFKTTHVFLKSQELPAKVRQSLFRESFIGAISKWHTLACATAQQRSAFLGSAFRASHGNVSPSGLRTELCCTKMQRIELDGSTNVHLSTSNKYLLMLLQALMALRVVSCLCQHGATVAQLLQFLQQWHCVPFQDAEPEAVMAALTGAAGLSPTEAVAAVTKYSSVLQHPPDEVRQRVGQQLPQSDGSGGSQATQFAQKCVLSPGCHCHARTLRLRLPRVVIASFVCIIMIAIQFMHSFCLASSCLLEGLCFGHSHCDRK